VSDEDFENVMVGLRETKAFIEGTADPATYRMHRPETRDGGDDTRCLASLG
jgi:hypothetical protein